MTAASAKLTVGPLLFHWPAEKVRDFYFRLADEAPVDSVCVGEVVCAKRAPFLEPMLPEIAERLERAGKEVVFSSLAMVMTPRERAMTRELADADAARMIEANDIAAVAMLDGRAHILGPFLNLYNEGTLGVLARAGARRVCLPVELPMRAIAALAAVDGPEIELFAFGRLPLALSARCYHARAHGLARDGCQFVCGEDADGLAVRTIDEQPFLAVNGIQTLSTTYANMIGELAELRAMGVHRFRLSPHDIDMVAIAATFRAVLDGARDAGEAAGRIAELMPEAIFSNGFYHGTEGVAALGLLADHGLAPDPISTP